MEITIKQDIIHSVDAGGYPMFGGIEDKCRSYVKNVERGIRND